MLYVSTMYIIVCIYVVGRYVRRKLLHRDLEKVSNKGIDFMSSYDDEKSASWERSKTARIFSSMNQLG